MSQPTPQWLQALEHALDLADQSVVVTDKAERERLLDYAVQAYQFGRRLKSAETRR